MYLLIAVSIVLEDGDEKFWFLVLESWSQGDVFSVFQGRVD
jgi:hypothetical protein